MKRKNLIKLLEEGFIDTGKFCVTYNIYELGTTRAFYNKYKDKVVCRFDINDLMEKL